MKTVNAVSYKSTATGMMIYEEFEKQQQHIPTTARIFYQPVGLTCHDKIKQSTFSCEVFSLLLSFNSKIWLAVRLLSLCDV